MSKPPAFTPTGSHETRLEFNLQATPSRVWTALTRDIAAWWPATFHTSPKTRRFVLEPRLGGMMGEITAPGEGLAWYRVIGVEKNVSLLLAGYLLPPWAGPATSLLRLTLTPAGDGETKLELADHTFGVVGDRSATADGWRQIFAGHLQPHVGRKPAPRLRRSAPR